jgi:ribonuclease D
MASEAAVEEVLIETRDGLTNFLGRFSGDSAPLPCSVDTEADSLHSHKEKLCLIQLSCGGEHRLIDPLTIEDLSPLIEFLDEREVWLHGADFDMSLLRRTFGWIPAKVYDTQIAARLVGHHRFGLAHLVEELIGIKLSKHSQRADWGKRPLPAKMVSYALDDVRYVLRIADMLMERLRELGRYEWFEQSCEGGRQLVLNRPERSEDMVWRIGGSGKLTGRGLAYLRELWKWRDHEAMLGDKPAFRVTANQLLIELAGRLGSGGRVEPPRRLPDRVKERFRAAIARADALPEDQWPEKIRGIRQKRDPKFKVRFTELQEKRNEIAMRLDIDETLIASKSLLEKLSVEPPAEAIDELLLPWQRELMFGDLS